MATIPERVKALFLAAIERADQADRRAFLFAEVGDGDDELRDRLDALLVAYDQPSPAALDRPPSPNPSHRSAQSYPICLKLSRAREQPRTTLAPSTG